jgi:hypothetical protein
MVVERKKQEIQQRMITLPYFDYEVPVLSTEDGRLYVPVLILCTMLGLRADTHIPRWRRLVIWGSARKLPFRTASGSKRIVWCLHLGAFPLWCACFNWSLVSPERQEQLQQATDAWCEHLDQAHREMLSQYQQMRHLLFVFLSSSADTERMLAQDWMSVHLLLDRFDLCIQFEDLLTRGRTLIREATALARSLVYQQEENPSIDAVRVSPENEVLEEFSLPLFPVILPQQRDQFFTYLTQLTHWQREFTLFLQEHIGA